MERNLGIALLLTAATGLSTTIGSLLGLAVSKPGPRFMGFTLGFSAGVMVLVSFVELFQGSIESVGFLSAHLGFFLGMAGFFLIDEIIPVAKSFGTEHTPILGIIAGMMVMAISLWMLR